MIVDQFHALTLQEQASMIKALRAIYAERRADVKAFREQERITRASVKEAKAKAKAERQAAAIVKAQARLAKLLEKQAAPVGVKALKAARKPGKVVTYGAEDNRIAQAIMAKKAKA